MKKYLALLLAVACLFSLVSVANAGGKTWHCDTCDADRDTEFCPECGKQRPADQTDEEEQSKPWPVRNLVETDTKLTSLGDSDQRHQSYLGPSKDYPGDGAYKPGKASSVKALLREGDYVLTDLTYPTVGRRILYFKASALKNNDVESVNLTGYPARTIGTVIPKQGPGSVYDNLMQTKKQDMSDYTYEEFYWYDWENGEWYYGSYWYNYENGSLVLEPGSNVFVIYLPENTEVSVFFETNGWVFAEFNCSLGKVRAWLPAATVK